MSPAGVCSRLIGAVMQRRPAARSALSKTRPGARHISAQSTSSSPVSDKLRSTCSRIFSWWMATREPSSQSDLGEAADGP